MASNQTPNLQLCQWEADDEVLRVDFNADNAKIDTAVTAAQKDISSVTASLTTLSARSGNCVMVTGSYTGSGKSGASTPCSLSFPYKPMLVLVDDMYTLKRPFTSSTVVVGSTNHTVKVTWGDRSVTWYAETTASTQCNFLNRTYYYIAFLDKENGET